MPIDSGNTFQEILVHLIQSSNLRYYILTNKALSSLYGIFLLWKFPQKKVFLTIGWHLNGKQDSLHCQMFM